MNKNTFFELTTKVLANEANEQEKILLNEMLKDKKYQKLFDWLEAEWEKELSTDIVKFNYSRGLAKLRAKIAESEKQNSETKVIPISSRILRAAAAIIVILLTSSVVLYQLKNDNPSITEFAENTTEEISSGETRLILNGEEEIEISSKNAEINYSEETGTIVVDNQKKIRQDLKQNEITYNTVIVPYGKRSKITLADNSIIWLNSGSKFIYPAHFPGKKREVFLEGEAFFEVQHDESKPFTVITNSIEVKVLGTVFNVTAYNDDVYTNTVLESGSVEIDYPGKSKFKTSKLKITPGTSAIYYPEEKIIQKKQVDTRYFTSWREGILLYQHQTLNDIVKKLSRYYNTEISITDPKLANTSFSGKLDLKADINEVLETIAFASEINIERKNNQYEIKN
ncbi:FecR domain-containing protein [Draconibacterium orientale]|uniref:FecR family protein n=1 Tax=Draconibacterium orientale TaxID=1168034 RepID=UPI0029C0D60A|nr:FecR domain-containing protein [Draconibacterium orientale]